MKNKKLIILIILGIAAFFSLIYGVVTSPKVVRQDQGVQSTERIVPSGRRVKKTGFSSWGRNPFSAAPIKTSGWLTLDGILWDKERPMAIINDTIREIGDRVGINTIVDIKQDRVILNDGSKDFELKLD